MVYKIYISAQKENEDYLAAIERALFSINEVALSALSAQEMPLFASKRQLAAKAMIQQSEIFIGLYGTSYGDIPDGATQSYQELEYQLATEYDTSMIIFMMQGAYEQADERQQDFLDHVMQNHVMNIFEDADDLGAKVKVAVDNYRQTKPHRRKIVPPSLNFRDRVPTPEQPQERDTTSTQEFDDMVNRAVAVAQDDIEQIVRRALEIHSAQQQMSTQPPEEYDNKITVAPLWGEPIRRSQFQSDIFMVMPFREKYDVVFQNVIRPVVSNLNLTIKRGDEFTSTRGSIMQEVWAALNACKLVIVETTEINANVYYELGIAHTLGKPTILLTQTKEIEDLPFDIRHLRFLVYEDTIEGSAELQKRLRRSIIWILNDLDEQSES